MYRSQTTLSLLLVTVLGVWGCSRGSVGGTASADAERIKTLEAKNIRLQEDYRAAAAAKDQMRLKLTAAEEMYSQARQEIDQLQEVVEEMRQDLRQAVKLRLSEREAVQVQFEQFRKEIRQLLGQAEAAVGTTSISPVTSVPVSRTTNRS